MLELLVVIVIVGLISSMAMLKVGSGGREKLLEREAQRLHQLLAVAAQQSILQSQEFGVLLDKEGYQFVVAGLTEWEELKGDDLLRPHTLPEGWGLEVVDGAEPIALSSSEESSQEDKAKPQPQIIFFSTGEATPFQLRLHAERGVGTFLLEGQANGKLKFTAEAPGA